jgi:hypothetical protein
MENTEITIPNDVTLYSEPFIVKSDLTMKELQRFVAIWDENHNCTDNSSFLALVLKDRDSKDLDAPYFDNKVPSVSDIDIVLDLQENFKKKYTSILNRYRPKTDNILDVLKMFNGAMPV